MRINVGCGATPTPGWTNFDNSFTVRIARWPRAVRLLSSCGVIAPEQAYFAEVARNTGIRPGKATDLPLPDHSVECIYSSHMVEHLDRDEVQSFLKECLRVLKSGGTIRLVLPDIRLIVDRYLASGDADSLVAGTYLAQPRQRSIKGRAHALLIGDRGHRWMYDGESAVTLLSAAGFEKAAIMAAGTTTISEPGSLDLNERWGESVYLEAQAPDQ